MIQALIPSVKGSIGRASFSAVTFIQVHYRFPTMESASILDTYDEAMHPKAILAASQVQSQTGYPAFNTPAQTSL